MALMMEEKYDDLAGLRERAKAEVSKVVIGQDRTVELLLIAAVAHGHVLLEGPPGSAKTLLARAVAHMLGAAFKRIQFTPDTTPVELNGQNVIRAGEHLFMPGAVFTNVLLADEINRTPPDPGRRWFGRRQGAQAPRSISRHRDPEPTSTGVFPPGGQLDRFLFKIELEYADAESGSRCQPPLGHRARHARQVAPSSVCRLDKATEAQSTPTFLNRWGTSSPSADTRASASRLGVVSRAMIHLVMAAKAGARDGRGTVWSRTSANPPYLRHRIAVRRARAWTPCCSTRWQASRQPFRRRSRPFRSAAPTAPETRLAGIPRPRG